MSAGLVVRLLGPPEILVDDAPMRVDTRKATAILAYLVATDQPQARERLAALFWPEADDRSARGALRRTLSTLRSALGDRWVVVDRTSVRLDREGVWTDVWQLADSNAQPRADELSTLLRGDFLAGFSLRDAPDFDDWVASQAEAWRQRSIKALDRLAVAQARAGNLPAAISAAERRVELDRLDEEGNRQLMELHARAGDRSAALRQYRSLVRQLAEELGVEPLPSTTALYSALLAGVRPASDTGLPAEAAPRRPLPLVGRARELDRMRAAWRASPTPVLLVEGEPGIGKSRLAEELVSIVERDGRRTLALRAHSGHVDVPYAPLVDVIERLADQEPGPLAALDARARSAAVRLVPRLSESRPIPAEAGAAAQARFVEGLSRLLATLAGDLLVVDDASWMDASSLGVLAHLIRNSGRLAGIAVFRRPVEPASDPLLPALADLRRTGSLVAISPGRLTLEEVRTLLTEAGVRASPEALHEESGGVPFYLAERVEAIRAGVPAEEIPTGIRDLVRTRAAACSQPAVQVLAAAVVLGGRFDPELLRAVSGRSPGETAEAVDELVARGLLVARSGRLELDHDLTRSVIDEDLGIGRRRLLHRRAAAALARRDGRRRAPAEVAGHLAAAGRDDEAASWYRLAGERSGELHAHEEAVRHFRAAIALAGSPDPALHELIAERLMLLGHYGDAASAFEAAAAGLPPDKAWRAELGLARAHRRLGNLALAEAHADSSLLAARAPADRAAALMELARLADRAGRNEEASARATEALQLVVAGGASLALAEAHNLSGLVARHRGDQAAAGEHLTEALRVAATLGAPQARMAALNNLALLYADQGTPDTAEARLRQALAIALATADRHHEAALRSNLADVLHAAGRRADAIAEVGRSAQIMAELGGLNTQEGEPTAEVWRLVDW